MKINQQKYKYEINISTNKEHKLKFKKIVKNILNFKIIFVFLR